MSNIIQSEQVENLIITIRGERVLLDSDVAMLYGVETRREIFKVEIFDLKEWQRRAY